MTPRFVLREPLEILGVASPVTRGTETPGLFAEIWKAFESRQEEIRPLATGARYYGVTFPTADPNVTDYLAGMAVPSASLCPEGLDARAIPRGTYAVFECPVDAIGATYRQVFAAWLPSATAQHDPGRPSFEEYPEDVGKEPVRLWIPIR
jgi:predicted transcriptional regulator YdeE